MQALSNSRVAVLLKRRNSHHVPEANHVDPNVSTAIQVSALLHDFIDSKARDSELWDLGGVPPFHKMIDQATCCWCSSICVAWDSEKETRS